MSVICQNFVQNAWKKDLCSNCFKSFDDHASMNGTCDNVTKTTWKSLITDRDRNGNCTKPFRLENGFHGKLLTIVPALNGSDIISNNNNNNNNNKKSEFLHLNGHSEKVIGILRIPGSEKRQILQTQTKINVGFKEEEPLVIGYGGNDYDADEPEWELSNNHEDSELILDSLDETEEDRAISKITRENTEFNAKNANLLICNQSSTEEERNAKNRRKGEPPPKASVKPFFRQTTWNEQSAVGNAVSDKQQPAHVINEISPVTSTETDTPCINGGERDDIPELATPKIEEECNQSVNGDINDVAATKSLVPRTSFLHGANEELTTPTALYTPGDDLFVTRSNSSSSEDTIPSREFPEEYVSDMNQQSDQPANVSEDINDNPQVPPKLADDDASGSGKVSENIDDSLLYDDGRTIYYAVSPSLAENEKNNAESHARSESIPIINHYAECKIYQDIEPNRTPSPPDGSRRSKLAALAVELEQARYSGGTPIKRQAPSPPDASGYSTPVQNISQSRNSLPNSACRSTSTPICTTPVINQDSANKQKSTSSSGGSRSKILMCISGSADDTFNKNRKKFSLKKLLKRGSRDVEDFPPIETGTPNPKAWKQNDFSKVKLEIIHPMDLVNDRKSPDLDRENVHASTAPSESGYDNLFIPTSSDNNESTALPTRTSVGSSRASTRPPRPPKPPPPPRSQSMIPEKSPKQQERSKDSPKISENKEEKIESPDSASKPQVPKRQYKCNGKSEYANLGDIRTSVAPKKPERTTTDVEKKQETSKKCDVYEPFDEQIYHDTLVSPPSKNAQDASSDTKKDENGTRPSDFPKVTHASPPVPPPPPYGRITCSSGSDDKSWINLEASYSLLSAVNLDVLARLLDNALHDRYYQLERPDKESLLWSDFDLEIEQPVQILSDKVIYDATFRHGNRMPVTLLVNPWGLHSSLSGSRNYARYPILAHFMDHVPRNYAFPEVGSSTNSEGILTSVYVLHRARLSPLRSLVEEQEYEREVFFVMLQLIHSLKILQASGIEDIEPGSHNVFFAKTEKDRLNSLVFLSPDLPFEQAGDLFLSTTDLPRISLCSYALSIMLLLLGIKRAEDIKTSKAIYKKAVLVITDVLLKEKSYSLSQAKSILDYVLWNAEEAVSTSDRMSLKTDGVLQRWLDVERARKLKNLAAGSLLTNLTAVEEHHLTFLVRSSVRTLREVAAML